MAPGMTAAAALQAALHLYLREDRAPTRPRNPPPASCWKPANGPGMTAAAALEAACTALGTRLFTLTTLDHAAGLFRRSHTSHPAEYPVTGTKPLTRDAWYQACIAARTPFVANTPEAFRAHFPDHALICSLGLGSACNIPLGRPDAPSFSPSTCWPRPGISPPPALPPTWPTPKPRARCSLLRRALTFARTAPCTLASGPPPEPSPPCPFHLGPNIPRGVRGV